MKRAISIILCILCVVLCFAGCSKKDARLNYNYDMTEYVTLGKYEGIEIDKKSEDYTGMYDYFHESYVANANLYSQVKEGEVKKGDTVNIDYEGKYADTGKAFDGGTATDQLLTIGSKSFIDGFEDGLIGKKVGSTVDLKLTFPEDYSNEDMANKKVVFTVKINYIQVVPEITDELAKKIGAKDKADYIAKLEREVAKQLIYNAISADTTFVYKSYPEAEQKECDDAYNAFMTNAQQQAESYNAQYKTEATAEDMVYYITQGQFTSSTQVKQYYINQMKTEMLFYAIFDAQQMELPENYDEFLKEVTGETDKEKLEEAKTQYTDEGLETLYVQETVFDFLIEKAIIK